MIYKKDNFYHVYNRGCNKERIFFDGTDYQKLLQKMKNTKASYGIEIIAYCLMPNHFHFLLFQSTDTPISKWLKVLFSGYVQYINRKYNRSGTLFERSAIPRLITNNNYIIRACHYIHANPLKHGFVSEAVDWNYSSLIYYLEGDFRFIDSRVNHLFFSNRNYKNEFAEYVENKYYHDEYPEKLSSKKNLHLRLSGDK
ncbi:MAG: transposase [Candidatus Cloacimonetes bacterium]|nr:transposase [Candidatus Cloacimonadota bacterium]MCF7814883.1 transposase [Candidatus Cloacimonadota bacterium]MCF7884568.1 transposase [Candidatus Cloacimonadota bacterium]